jgi:ribonuclease Z
MCISNMQELGLSEFRSVLNDHCKHSFGLVLVSEAGWKFVFSGDTRLCDNVVNAAAGADLLIHEATFDRGLEEDAKRKKHSTIDDALEVRTCVGCICACWILLSGETRSA